MFRFFFRYMLFRMAMRIFGMLFMAALVGGTLLHLSSSSGGGLGGVESQVQKQISSISGQFGAAASGTAPSGLPYSTASASTSQPQPAPGSCHAGASGLYSTPDPRCTPGAANPAVTQSTIHSTICVHGWTATVRPPESVTEPEKYASMDAYGDTGSARGYEFDHDLPLELGGAVNDPRNLWPEPGASPNPKDKLESILNSAVCRGRMSLARAQHDITSNWVHYYRVLVG